MSDFKLANDVVNAFGVDIKISDVIGEKLVNQWMAQISEADMSSIIGQINDEIFVKCSEPKKLRCTTKGWQDKDTEIWRATKQAINNKLGDIIASKIDDIVNSEEFQKKSDEIAQELVDYATEGYKEDLKNRIRQRLVNNVLDNEPQYYGLDLRALIHQEISTYLNTRSNY